MENGTNCNVQSESVHTALYYACSNCYDEVVELLLERGANPNIQNGYGDTALFTHIIHGLPRNTDSKITELLLKHGADLNIKNDNGDTTLYQACYRRNHRVIELLLKYGADPSNNTSFLAFWEQYDEIMELLLQYRTDPNAILGRACKSGDVGVVKLLLKYGADPNKKVGDKDSPIELVSTAWCRNSNKIRKLLAQYGGINKKYLMLNTGFAFGFCCLAVGFAIWGTSSSLYFIPAVVFALPALLFTYNALDAFIKPILFPTKPSPEFAEVITEKVVNNVGLNTEDNSQ